MLFAFERPLIDQPRTPLLIDETAPRGAIEELGEVGNIFVMVVYRGDAPQQVILRRGIWNGAKKKLDKIEAAAEASVQQAIAAIDKLQSRPVRAILANGFDESRLQSPRSS